MRKDVVAVMSMSSGLGKDKMMQAAGRLRKFGRNQKIIIALSSEIKN